MKTKVVLAEFRSKDTAQQAIQKLGEHGIMGVSMQQIADTPIEGIDTMSNAYAGELPLFARGIKGSDIAIEGTTDTLLYNHETADQIMGEGAKVENAYLVAVDITNQEETKVVEKILQQHGAETRIKTIED
ncbi:MAG: hypothetical protein GX922_00545 [Firmicutes bacterium]|nr:hypothetical protein [Bacillota bacterium]